MVKYLQLMLIRAVKINACTSLRARTRVYAKASYKNTVHTTSSAEDMGQNPVFSADGTNVFHFVYENEAEFITIELFNRNHTCIGISKLFFTELAELRPEQDPEEKTLPVHVVSRGYQKPFGELILTAQIKQQKAEGKEGNLNVVLKQGNIKNLISIFKSKTTKMNAQLTYKHTTLSSETLEGMGNKFVWHAENTFTFIINSCEPDDVIEIEVYNGVSKVGQCKIPTSLLVTGEGIRADAQEGVTRTADLLVKNKNVGSIEVAATFTKTIVRRNSYPQGHAPTPPLYAPLHVPNLPGISPHLVHQQSQRAPNIFLGYPVDGSPSSSVPFQLYPPERQLVQPVRSAAPGPYEPSAPSAPPQPFYPPVVYPSAVAQVHQLTEAHGAPPSREEKEALFKDHPDIAKFVADFL